jgi:hypothetical protein
MTEVAEAIVSGLRVKVDAARQQGRGAADLGRPTDVAARMLDTVPVVAPSPWSALGPFYSGAGVARMLGGVTRQAVDDRRRRRRIVALRTSDDVWLYPAFQFDAAGRLVDGIARAFGLLVAAGLDDWTAASTLVGTQPELGERSIVEHLRADGAMEPIVALVEHTAAAHRR